MIPGQDPILVYLEVIACCTRHRHVFSRIKNSVTLKASASEQLTVTEKTTKANGSSTEKNVTTNTIFRSANPKVVTLNKGLVTAVGPGETIITVTHPNFTTTVTAIVRTRSNYHNRVDHKSSST